MPGAQRGEAEGTESPRTVREMMVQAALETLFGEKKSLKVVFINRAEGDINTPSAASAVKPLQHR